MFMAVVAFGSLLKCILTVMLKKKKPNRETQQTTDRNSFFMGMHCFQVCPILPSDTVFSPNYYLNRSKKETKQLFIDQKSPVAALKAHQQQITSHMLFFAGKQVRVK